MNYRQDAAFDPYAKTYDETVDKALAGTGTRAAYFPRYRARYLFSRLRFASGARVLDYGCGTGNLSAELQAMGPRVQIDGYDPSEESIARVPEDLRNRGIFTCEMSALAGEYDYILLSMVLHHITPKERNGTLVALRERLAGDGHIIIFEHNPANPLTRRIVDKCPFDEDAVLVRSVEAGALLDAAGFRRLRLDFMGFFPPPLGGLDRFFTWCPWGAQYAVTAAKGHQ